MALDTTKLTLVAACSALVSQMLSSVKTLAQALDQQGKVSQQITFEGLATQIGIESAGALKAIHAQAKIDVTNSLIALNQQVPLITDFVDPVV